MIKFKIEPNTLKALEVFAGVKDIRSYLNGIHVRVIDPATLRLTATNGTILARYWHKLDKGDPNEFTPGEEGIIPLDIAKGVKMPKYNSGIELTLDPRTNNDGTWQAQLLDVQKSGTLIEGRYPDVDRVWPRRVDVRPGYYDSALVARLEKAASLLHENARVAVIPNGRSGPGVFKIRSDFAGIIMPMRFEETDLVMPDWSGTAIQHTRERVVEALATSASYSDSLFDRVFTVLRAVDPDINVSSEEAQQVCNRCEAIKAFRTAEAAA